MVAGDKSHLPAVVCDHAVAILHQMGVGGVGIDPHRLRPLVIVHFAPFDGLQIVSCLFPQLPCPGLCFVFELGPLLAQELSLPLRGSLGTSLQLLGIGLQISGVNDF